MLQGWRVNLLYVHWSKHTATKEEESVEELQTRIEQFPATNPNSVLSTGKDGIVLYSNMAGEPLLHEWVLW